MDSLYFLIKSQSFGESPNLFNMNSDFPPIAKDSSPRETIPYICDLGAKVGCKRLSEHSTCSD